MKPWVWGLLVAGGVVVGIGIGWGLAGTGAGGAAGVAAPSAGDPAMPVATKDARIAELEAEVDRLLERCPPEELEDDPEDPAMDTDTDAELNAIGAPGSVAGEGPGPDLTPETVTEAEFNSVVDEVIEKCGLGVWSEMDRECTGGRCTLYLGTSPEEGFPTYDVVTGCAPWKNKWGWAIEATSTRVTCDDGEQIEVTTLGPSSKELQRKSLEGEGFTPPTQEELAARLCPKWGK